MVLGALLFLRIGVMIAVLHSVGSLPSLHVLLMKVRMMDSSQSDRFIIISLVILSGPGAFPFLHFFKAFLSFLKRPRKKIDSSIKSFLKTMESRPTVSIEAFEQEFTLV